MTRKWNTTKWNFNHAGNVHYSEVIMSAMASQITGVLIVCLNVCSVADRRKHQSSMSLAFVRGIHRWQVNSPHKGPVTRKMFPFDDVIMEWKSFGEMGPRTLRQPNLRKVRRPTVPWKGRNESPLIDIHSSIKAHYGNQSRGYFKYGRPLWPPAVPRLAARPSQSNPRGSGPEVVKRERGHVTSETWSLWGGGLQGPPA